MLWPAAAPTRRRTSPKAASVWVTGNDMNGLLCCQPVVVAHTILIIAYRIIRDGTTYEDLGSNYFDERDRRAALHSSIHRPRRLGYKVTVEEAA